MSEDTRKIIDAIAADGLLAPSRVKVPRVPRKRKALTAESIPASSRRRLGDMRRPTARNLRRAAIYTRYSTDGQEVKSEERQIADVRAYAEKHSYSIVDVFSDRGMTGTSIVHRDGLRRMMELARRNGCDLVIVEDLDRLSRHLPDTMAIFYELKLLGIEIHDLDGKLDLLHIVMRGYLSEETRVRFLALSKAGKRQAVRDGYLMNKVAFGYLRIVGGAAGVHEPHPVNADIVRRIFQWIGEGVSASAVARILTDMGVLPPAQSLAADNGAPPSKPGIWLPNTVVKIVRNHLYIGLVSWGKTTPVYDYGRRTRTSYETTDESTWTVIEFPELRLVDEVVWARANLRLQNDGHGGHMHLGRFLLTGKAFCACCGGPLAAKGSAVRTYYVCTTNYNGGAKRCAMNAKFRIDFMERAVLTEVAANVLTSQKLERLASVFRAEVRRLVGDDDRRLVAIEKRLEAIHALIKASFEDDVARGLSGRRRDRLRTGWEDEADALEEERKDLRRTSDYLGVIGSLEALRDGIGKMLADVPFRPQEADGILLAQAFRDGIGAVRVHAPDEAGYVRLEIIVDAMGRRGVADVLADPDTTETYVTGFDPALLLKEDRRRQDAARVDALVAAAARGDWDLADEQWDAVSGLVAGVDMVVDGLVVDPRVIVDGMVLYCIEGGPIWRVPTRYYAPNVFERAAKRIVYALAWDRIVEMLVDAFPDEFDRAEMNYFDSSEYPRSLKGGKAPVGEALEAAKTELERLAATLPEGDPVRLRYEAVHAILSGSAIGKTADRLGLARAALYHTWDKFKAGGLPTLVPDEERVYKEPLIDATQAAMLGDIVRTGVHPVDDRFLTYPILVEVCRWLFVVKYSRGGMRLLCVRNGFPIRAPVAAAKRRVRLLTTPGVEMPPSVHSDRGRLAADRARRVALRKREGIRRRVRDAGDPTLPISAARRRAAEG